MDWQPTTMVREKLHTIGLNDIFINRQLESMANLPAEVLRDRGGQILLALSLKHTNARREEACRSRLSPDQVDAAFERAYGDNYGILVDIGFYQNRMSKSWKPRPSVREQVMQFLNITSKQYSAFFRDFLFQNHGNQTKAFWELRLVDFIVDKLIPENLSSIEPESDTLTDTEAEVLRNQETVADHERLAALIAPLVNATRITFLGKNWVPKTQFVEQLEAMKIPRKVIFNPHFLSTFRNTYRYRNDPRCSPSAAYRDFIMNKVLRGMEMVDKGEVTAEEMKTALKGE